MNIAQAIMYLYPNADPMRDFIVRDNGAEPVLREGAEEKGLVKYEIKPLKYGEDGEVIEEAIEGVHYRYGIDYNLLAEGEDYDMIKRGQYISYWDLDVPQPTEEDLLDAWEAYEEYEQNKPPQLSEYELQQEENASLWYENMMLSKKTTSNEEEIASLWYEIMTI